MEEENKFKDRFGQIIISPTYIERVRDENEEDMWEKIDDFFDADELVEKIHYSEIEDIEFQPESTYPTIQIKTDGEWRRLPLEGDDAKKVFTRLRYRYQAFLQNR
jgi:hypothetical protein